MATFGEKLRGWREIAGLSQVEMAERLGVTQQTVSDWERDRGLPHQSRASKIEEVLDLGPQVALLAIHAASTGHASSGGDEPEPADLDGRLAELTDDERQQVQGYIDALLDRRRP